MKCARLLATALLGALAQAAAVVQPLATEPLAKKALEQRSDTETYAIEYFGLRKYDGVTVATVFFDIVATNGGTLNFSCSPEDVNAGTTAQVFVSKQEYKCIDSAAFTFSYNLETFELNLSHDISPGLVVSGNVITGEPLCRAGGTSPTDKFCSIPPQVKLSITLSPLAVP